VGDLIKIEQGMSIPADCILIEGTDIGTDESTLTGEPELVDKYALNSENYSSNPNPFLYAKTLLGNGQGIALVCAVGPNTRSGMAANILNIEDDKTPL
jgi:magnesium-transporting ATPase (P-type)